MWWYVTNNYKYVSHNSKGVLDSSFNLAVIDKISDFMEIAPNVIFIV